MFFKKKKMVELGDIQRRSVNLPHGKTFVPKDGYGFVDLTKKPKLPSEIAKEKALLGKMTTMAKQPEQSASSFNFFDTPSTSYPSQSPSASNSDNDELLRKISSQISDLDSKLYKMEQRLEVVERKSGINNSSNSSGFGW